MHSNPTFKVSDFKVGDFVLYHGQIGRVVHIIPGRQYNSAATGHFSEKYETLISVKIFTYPIIISESELLVHQTPWFNDHGRWTPLYRRHLP